MTRVTKAMVLAGLNYRHAVKVEGIGEFVIRPLTQVEAEAVQAIALENLDSETVGKMSKIAAGDFSDLSTEEMAKAQANDAKGNCTAVAMGLSCDGESWGVEDVKQLPANVFDELKTTVFAISGMGKDGAALAAKFLVDE